MTGALDPSLRGLNDCGCCEGIADQTPIEVYNRPGLSAIAYRVGIHAQFKQSLLASLSNSELPALRGLTIREDRDFAIALLDAWATVADVLTFYDERIANDFYCRTATERLSLLHLARLIGYELRPGVAASTHLAFTVEDAPGSPGKATIDVGTKVQSVPGPGEQPQTFETVEKIEARAEWNAIKPRLTEPQDFPSGFDRLILDGTATNLKSGDILLIIVPIVKGVAGLFRVIEVVADSTAQKTIVKIQLEGRSAANTTSLVLLSPIVYSLRTRASLFGHNAPDWKAMPQSIKNAYGINRIPPNNPDVSDVDWPLVAFSRSQIDLDLTYSQIGPASWIVLSKPDSPLTTTRINSLTETTVTGYTLSTKVTRLTLEDSVEIANLAELRKIAVYAQSEELTLAEQPLIIPIPDSPSERLILDEKTLRPVEGDQIALSQIVQGLVVEQTLIVSGNRIRAKVTVARLYLTSANGLQNFALKTGDVLQVMESPVVRPLGKVEWHLRSQEGFDGYVTTELNAIHLTAAAKEDEVVSEVVKLKSASEDLKTLYLVKALTNSFDRATVTINANVALANHGETVQEVLGSGNASQPYQSFTLRQPPLTYVSASTPSGAASTLRVRINDLLWHEVPTLYGKGAEERVYVTHNSDDGKTTIVFGSRLPTGQENVRATYRKGIGLGGLVKANQLSQLMTRPLGVKGVTNPQDATGAEDPESLEQARLNAPLTVLTLDRIVSLQDYEDFARAFGGVAKALATWTWNGQQRGVFVTVAGSNGAGIKSDSPLSENLLSQMQKAGDRYVPLQVKSYRPAFFRIQARVKIDPDYLSDKVLAAVWQALRTQFSFDARAFGQGVALSEAIAIIHAVPGVVAVDVDKFYRFGETEDLQPRLAAAAPQAGADGTVAAAELLTLDPNSSPDDLGVMV